MEKERITQMFNYPNEVIPQKAFVTSDLAKTVLKPKIQSLLKAYTRLEI